MNIFDIIGPVMIGPSSSHTAGACRIGLFARMIANEDVKDATIYLSGSFAETYRGHGTDKAIVAGLMGFLTSDERIRNSMEIAKENGVKIEILKKDIELAHPNTARIIIRKVNGSEVVVTGCSIGGGNVIITKINNIDVNLDGMYDSFIIPHKDIPGMITKISTVLSSNNININGLNLCRNKKGDEAIVVVQVDNDIKGDNIIEELKALDGVLHVTLVKALKN